MKNSVQQFWNLSSPKMARDFIKNLRIGPKGNGSAIKAFRREDGSEVLIDNATDEEILKVAIMIAEQVGVKR